MFHRIFTNNNDVVKTACNVISCIEDKTNKMKNVEILDMIIDNDKASILFYLNKIFSIPPHFFVFFAAF